MSSSKDHLASESKSRFLLRNLLIGLFWFGLIISGYILAEDYLLIRFDSYITSIQDNQVAFFAVFTISEIFFGIIPPEFFMMISMLHKISLTGFIINLITYAVISYIAGVIGYAFGRSFSNTRVYQRIRSKYLVGYESKLNRFGVYLVFVGAITPVPFSATCMLAGSVKLPMKQFLLVSSSRLIRFGAYGWLVWNFPQWFQT